KSRVRRPNLLLILHHAAFHRHSQRVSDRIRAKASAVGPAFVNLNTASGYRVNPEVNVVVILTSVAMAQTDHPIGAGFARREFHVTIARVNRLGGGCPSIA